MKLKILFIIFLCLFSFCFAGVLSDLLKRNLLFQNCLFKNSNKRVIILGGGAACVGYFGFGILKSFTNYISLASQKVYNDNIANNS
jgi:hypothetical protein